MGGGCPTARHVSGGQDPILVQPAQHPQERVRAWRLEAGGKIAGLDSGKETAGSVGTGDKREH